MFSSVGFVTAVSVTEALPFTRRFENQRWWLATFAPSAVNALRLESH